MESNIKILSSTIHFFKFSKNIFNSIEINNTYFSLKQMKIVFGPISIENFVDSTIDFSECAENQKFFGNSKKIYAWYGVVVVAVVVSDLKFVITITRVNMNRF